MVYVCVSPETYMIRIRFTDAFVDVFCPHVKRCETSETRMVCFTQDTTSIGAHYAPVYIRVFDLKNNDWIQKDIPLPFPLYVWSQVQFLWDQESFLVMQQGREYTIIRCYNTKGVCVDGLSWKFQLGDLFLHQDGETLAFIHWAEGRLVLWNLSTRRCDIIPISCPPWSHCWHPALSMDRRYLFVDQNSHEFGPELYRYDLLTEEWCKLRHQDTCLRMALSNCGFCMVRDNHSIPVFTSKEIIRMLLNCDDDLFGSRELRPVLGIICEYIGVRSKNWIAIKSIT
jgi:hypothetical protein